MHRLKVLRAALAVAVSLWSGLASMAAGPTIAEIAPEDSLFVAGVDDFDAFKATLDRSPYGVLWADPEFRAYLRGLIGDTFEAPRRALADLGIDFDTFKPPAGSTGLAAFFRKPPPATKAGRSPWEGVQGLIYADFLDDAASSDAVWNALERLADREVKDGLAKKSEVEHGGAFITAVEINYEEIDRRANERQQKAQEAMRAKRAQAKGRDGAGAEPDPEAMDEDEIDWQPPSTLATSGLPPAVYMTRVKGVIAACSHLETLKDAMDRFNGEPARSKSVSDAAVFSEAMAQHGKAALGAPHLYAALLTASASEFFVRFASGGGEADDAEPELMGPMGKAEWAAIFAGLGLDKVRAVSLVARFDTQDAGMEQSVAILVPEKRGLVALFDVAEQPFAAPSVAPADAAGVLVQHVKFAEVPGLVRSVVAGLPEESRARGQGFLDFALPQIEPLMSALGTELVMTKRIERPFAGSSAQKTWAVRIADQAKFVGALSTFTANFGMQPRDFLGNQVWGAPGGGMTIGVGAGRVILGDAAAVEGALRESSEPGRPRLSEEPGFAAALRAVRGSGLGYYYTQARAEIEYASWRAANVDTIIAEQLEGFDGDPEEARRYSEMMKASMPAWSKRAMPVAALLRATGDDIMEIRSTPEGFVSRSLTLRPSAR